MNKYYAKQVDPEWQEDNLFYTYKDKNTGKYELGWNDDVYQNNVIIYGNKEYRYFLTKEFENLLMLEKVDYEYENGYWKNISEFVYSYFPKSNGKYSTKELHEWKLLLERYFKDYCFEKIVCDALKLMTGKTWRTIKIVGCMQSEWQYGYASEDITEEDVDYIEICYFNTGTEWLFYESEEDMNDDCASTSYYIRGYKPKEELCRHIGCKEEELVCLEFDGYTKTPKYKEL